MEEYMIDFSKIFTWQNIVIYLLIMNFIAFFAMWIDKRKAKYGKYRISESTLLILATIGGGVGALIGMYKFRHKTQKPRFYIGIPVIMIVEVLIILFFVFVK